MPRVGYWDYLSLGLKVTGWGISRIEIEGGDSVLPTSGQITEQR